MAITQRPTRTIKWGESGNKAEPSSEKQELGWVIEKPPYEEMNWIHYEQDTATQYLLQEVGAEWYSEQPYSSTSRVQYNNIIYKSKNGNIGKQPDISPLNWEVAYSDYSLTIEVNNVLTQDNYADKLVYKDEPIVRSKAIGVGYESNIGTSNDVGYTFKGYQLDGLFHNGADTVVLKDGLEVAKFSPISNINESNKKVVTMDILQQYLQQYKVGDIYFTSVAENPSTRLGYGTWEKYGKGRAFVGHTDDVTAASPDWTKVGGGTHGTYTETLSINQIPKIRAEIPMTRAGTRPSDNDWTFLNESDGHANDGVPDSFGIQKSREFGGGQSHNNVQPSIVIYAWRRTK